MVYNIKNTNRKQQTQKPTKTESTETKKQHQQKNVCQNMQKTLTTAQNDNQQRQQTLPETEN